MKTTEHFAEVDMGKALLGLVGVGLVAGALYTLNEEGLFAPGGNAPGADSEAIKERLMPIGRVRLATQAPAETAPANQDTAGQAPPEPAAPSTQPQAASEPAEPSSNPGNPEVAATREPTPAAPVAKAPPTPVPAQSDGNLPRPSYRQAPYPPQAYPSQPWAYGRGYPAYPPRPPIPAWSR